MSREAILNNIRRGLKRGPLPADQQAMLHGRMQLHPRQLIPARSRVSRAEQVALFIANVEKEFGTVTRVADAAQILGEVAAYLAKQNLPAACVVASHPYLRDLDWAAHPLLQKREGRAQPSDQVALTCAFAGIAETGTLMLPSGPETPTTLNVLTETSIVVLRASLLTGAYEEAWDRLRADHADQPGGGFMPRNVMLVTGPSRSADIESILELGAHGPRRLHVVLVDDDPAALA